MDVIESNESFFNDSKIRNKIKAIAFTYSWDELKVLMHIARAWREGRVVDSYIAILEECENSATSLKRDSGDSTGDFRPVASTGAQERETSFSTSESVDGASISSASLLGMAASLPVVDVTDKVPTDCVSVNVPVAETSDNVPINGVSDNVPFVAFNVGVSEGATNDMISSNVPSATVNSKAPSAHDNSPEPRLHEQVRALQNENRLLVKQIMCLHCSTAERDSLFMPCGHFIMCSSCSDKCSVCPLCNVTILATSRTRL